MIVYRPFLNTDPPFLADVWRSHTPLRGLAQAITTSLLERHVFAKPYFEREGLIVAEEDGRCLGFAHGGFGPREDRASLGNEVGVVSRLMVVEHEDREQVAAELLKRIEVYLQDKGANRIVAGGYPPHNPFYLGLYGGSRLPGILSEDAQLLALFKAHGYERLGEQAIMQCRLAGFRPAINRNQMTVRRSYQIMAVIDPIPETWWDACTLGMTDRTKFILTHRQSGDSHGYVTFWDMEPLASNWGVHSMGLFDLYVEPEHRRKGLATFLIGESLRQLQAQGITVAEFQTTVDDSGPLALFEKLGFEMIDRGHLLEKKLS